MMVEASVGCPARTPSQRVSTLAAVNAARIAPPAWSSPTMPANATATPSRARATAVLVVVPPGRDASRTTTAYSPGPARRSTTSSRSQLARPTRAMRGRRSAFVDRLSSDNRRQHPDVGDLRHRDRGRVAFKNREVGQFADGDASFLPFLERCVCAGDGEATDRLLDRDSLRRGVRLAASGPLLDGGLDAFQRVE